MSKGFLTVQLQVGAAVLALLTAFLYKDFTNVLGGIHTLGDDLQLYEAARYMQAELEKDLAYESTAATIRKDFRGNKVLQCQTIYAGKQYLYTCENNGLYKQTDTLLTKGKNPLFIPDCQVQQWQVRKLGDRVLAIQFVLVREGRAKSFTQTVSMLNGVVTDAT